MVRALESRDRITRIRIQGLRSLEDVTLELAGLSVLIGDNGTGKSAIIEALETLRYFSERAASVNSYFEEHPWSIRSGRGKLKLAIDIVNDDEARAPRLNYEFAIVYNDSGRMGVATEQLLVGPLPGKAEPLVAIRRDYNNAEIFDQGQRKLVKVHPSPLHLLMTQVANDPVREGEPEVQQAAVNRMAALLQRIEVHVPFESMAAWAARRTGRRSASREPQILQPTNRLELLAANLGNAYHSLKNEHGTAHWKETMEYVSLGLGLDVDDVGAIADAAGGQHAITVRYKSSGLVPSSALSDGTLAYLAFVALLRLPSERSLLAFDEPELHLHPGLLVRVLAMLERIAEECPVVIATHSDRLLDALATPAASTVVCELGDHRQTRLRRLSSELLAEWMRDFRGLGDLRASGLGQAVLQPPDAEK